MGSYNEIVNLVSAHAAVAHPLSGATKDAKRSISLPALSTLGYSSIPPPTADLPKRFGLCLLTVHINGALHCFTEDSTRLRQQFPQRVSLLGVVDRCPLVWYLRLVIAEIIVYISYHIPSDLPRINQEKHQRATPGASRE